MTMRARPPGPELLDEERWGALLGDAIDGLMSLQLSIGRIELEDIVSTLRYVRAQLLKRVPPDIDHGQEVDDVASVGQ